MKNDLKFYLEVFFTGYGRNRHNDIRNLDHSPFDSVFEYRIALYTLSQTIRNYYEQTT